MDEVVGILDGKQAAARRGEERSERVDGRSVVKMVKEEGRRGRDRPRGAGGGYR